MSLNPLTKLITLAVQLVLLICVMASPVSAKSALGSSSLDYQVAMGEAVGKSLNVLDVFLEYRTRALGCCVVPEGIVPPKTNTTTQPWKHENRIEITRKDASDC
jgi:hypothetical protein